MLTPISSMRMSKSSLLDPQSSLITYYFAMPLLQRPPPPKTGKRRTIGDGEATRDRLTSLHQKKMKDYLEMRQKLMELAAQEQMESLQVGHNSFLSPLVCKY